jgi:GT2 family glycosyltransferase
MTPRLSVGVTTRNRPESLQRCLASLSCIAHLAPEVMVFDDGSDVQVSVALDREDGSARIIRDDSAPGYIAGRNRLVREASAPCVLLMDDDAALVGSDGIDTALSILESDEQVAAVGFAQVDVTGTPWPGTTRSADSRPRYVPAYTGFAHVVRRDLFLELGGYRERFVFYGEEKEFCLRLLDAGRRIVYLPGAAVAHEPDPSGRSRPRYLRYVTRNDCLNALYNQPLRRALWIVPARLMLYFRMRRAWNISDPLGWWWVCTEVIGNALPVLRERHAVSADTLRLWRQFRDNVEAYVPSSRATQTCGGPPLKSSANP